MKGNRVTTVAKRSKKIKPRAKLVTELMGISGNPFPDRMPVTLKWAINLPNGAPGTTFQTWRGGAAPFDPDQTGVGDQPVGFDEWMAFYKYYVVMRSRVRVRFMDFSVLGSISVFPSRDTSTVGSLTEAVGQAHSKTEHGGIGTSIADVRISLDHPEFFGLTPAAYRANEQAWGTNASNPTDIVYWTVYEQTANATNLNMAGTYFIEMDVEFFARQQVNGS